MPLPLAAAAAISIIRFRNYLFVATYYFAFSKNFFLTTPKRDTVNVPGQTSGDKRIEKGTAFFLAGVAAVRPLRRRIPHGLRHARNADTKNRAFMIEGAAP